MRDGEDGVTRTPFFLSLPSVLAPCLAPRKRLGPISILLLLLLLALWLAAQTAVPLLIHTYFQLEVQ